MSDFARDGLKVFYTDFDRLVSKTYNGFEMRIGVLADTHIREAELALPYQLIEAFWGVNLILHAGDIYVPEVLDKLEQIAPVLAASGDDDCGAILADKRVKPLHVLTLEGKKLWLMHESPQYYQSKSRRTSAAAPQADAPDLIVFGHTHYSILECHNGTLFVNPGSPLDSHLKLGTVATLTLEPDKPAQAKLVHLEAYSPEYPGQV